MKRGAGCSACTTKASWWPSTRSGRGGRVNYQIEHYKAGLSGKLADGEQIDEMAAANIARFKGFGE